MVSRNRFVKEKMQEFSQNVIASKVPHYPTFLPCPFDFLAINQSKSTKSTKTI